MNWEWWSWIAQVVETIVVLLLAPVAIWQLSLQIRAARAQELATLHQTFATIVSWIEAEDVRASRRLLFDTEDARGISRLPVSQWEQDWKQAVDRVSSTLNAAASVVRLDPRLWDMWALPSRRLILKSWEIAEPRIRQRRAEAGSATLWADFEWLAQRAREG